MPDSSFTPEVKPPLNKEDLDRIWKEYVFYSQKVQEDSTTLGGGDFKFILKLMSDLLDFIDFLGKENAAKTPEVTCEILYHTYSINRSIDRTAT
jgi:hypothetical protein